MVHLREDFNSIWISDLAQQVNIFLELEGEKLRLQPRKVGAVLTSLGFSSRTRTNSGWVLSLIRRDAEKLHQLAASYGVDRAGRSFRGISPDECPLCRAAGLNKKGPALAPEGTRTMTVNLRKELVHETHRHGRNQEQQQSQRAL
jgi:hypothetical protein